MFSQSMSSDLPVFLIRIAVVSFFSIGFIQYFQRLWNDAFAPEEVAVKYRWLRRVMLTVISVVLGMFTHYDAMMFIHNSTAIMYHNWALFLLVVPLLFGGFSKLEVGIQAAAIVWIWYMHHAPVFWEPANLATLMAFGAAAILLKVFREYVLQKWWVGVAGSFVLASLFWFTVPPVSMGMKVDSELALEAVLFYTLMMSFVLGYWLRQYREDIRNRKLERLAEYERGTHDNSYANHQEELKALFMRTKETGIPLTFATLDLDHFKNVNGRFGHLAGNAVLIGVTETMREILANAHVEHSLFLTTGEEFNVVFPNQSPEAVLPILKACWQGVRKREYTYEDRSIEVTMSVGMTGIHADDTGVNDIYKRADDALSKSKRSGRDTIVLDEKVVSGADRMEKRLTDYRYFSQGIYDVTSPERPKVYHELLLRTYDVMQKRWILPDSFEIPVWMQITLIKEFMANTDLQHFNVNLTAEQFQDIEIANALTQFAESPEGPESLSIEIMDLTDSQTTRRISSLYRSANMKILIDDVGSDNSFEAVRSSLPYVNGIKFAMQNLRKSTSAEDLQERVAFWRKIAEDNHLSFILEGVENEEDFAMAAGMNIPYVQGYYFGKPAQAEKRTDEVPVVKTGK